MENPALGRVVEDTVNGEQGRSHCSLDAEWLALPQRATVGVDDTRRVKHLRDVEAFVESPRETERDESTLRERSSYTDADHCSAQAGVARRPRLRPRGTDGRHPVSVHAMLRTVSLRLSVATNAADGSKPEWMPQCSQRGSLPGP